MSDAEMTDADASRTSGETSRGAQRNLRRSLDPSPDSSPDNPTKKFLTDDGFQLVTKGALPQPPKENPPVETRNPFNPLSQPDLPQSNPGTSNDPDTPDDAPTTQQPPQQLTKTTKGRIGLFRIDLTTILDPTELIKELKNNCNNHLTAKCTRTELLIQPLTVTAHGKIRDCLDLISRDPRRKGLYFTNISYHFNRATEEQRDKFVIKGLPTKYDLTAIKTNLTTLNITAHHVTEMQRRDADGNLTPIGLYTVETNKKEMTEIKKTLRFIDYFKVTIEDYKATDRIPQCRNCQRLYHTKAYCRRQTTCALCACFHPTEDCPSHTSKNPFTPRCANCSQNHPAYDQQCPVIAKAREQRNTQLNKSTTHQPPSNTPQNFPPLRPQNQSYASATNPTQTPTQQQSTSSTTQDIKELLSLLQNPTIKKIILNLKPLLEILKGPEDIITKLITVGIKLVEILN